MYTNTPISEVINSWTAFSLLPVDREAWIDLQYGSSHVCTTAQLSPFVDPNGLRRFCSRFHPFRRTHTHTHGDHFERGHIASFFWGIEGMHTAWTTCSGRDRGVHSRHAGTQPWNMPGTWCGETEILDAEPFCAIQPVRKRSDTAWEGAYEQNAHHFRCRWRCWGRSMPILVVEGSNWQFRRNRFHWFQRRFIHVRPYILFAVPLFLCHPHTRCTRSRCPSSTHLFKVSPVATLAVDDAPASECSWRRSEICSLLAIWKSA